MAARPAARLVFAFKLAIANLIVTTSLGTHAGLLNDDELPRSAIFA